MISFIKAIIRALLVRKYRLSCTPKRWAETLRELDRRGKGCHEAGAFLLGVIRRNGREVRDVVYYDDLDPDAYESGVCILHGNAFAKLWSICRDKGLTVVADVHTHPGLASQSSSDRTNPMIAQPGHIAIIVPNFARQPVVLRNLGIYEYCGEHRWNERGGMRASTFFYTGLWS